jgi:hypothetical protein
LARPDPRDPMVQRDLLDQQDQREHLELQDQALALLEPPDPPVTVDRLELMVELAQLAHQALTEPRYNNRASCQEKSDH